MSEDRGSIGHDLLHTIRSLSGLPGRGMPWRYGRYVAREDFTRYLDAYRETLD